MAKIAVRKADNTTMDSLNNILNAIRNRAYQISQGGSGNSDASSNWAQAERDLFCVPNSQLMENDSQFQVQIALPGCDASSMEIVATSNSIVIRAAASRQSASLQDRTLFSDMDARTMYRRFDFSSSIDISQVTANLDNGMLSISAQKAASSSKSSAAGA